MVNDDLSKISLAGLQTVRLTATLFNRNNVRSKSGNSSVGRAQPCQGWGREFESRFPLLKLKSLSLLAGWQSGYAAACKAVDAGSIPTPALYF